ncbi:Rho-binding antiterminator [Shewanella sp.]|nr:Rho-binding antiterminator [Shewanella sp.]
MMDCNEHDYIEIVCLYRYPVKLTLKVGDAVNGIALDTVRNEHRHECIKLNQNGTDILVELDSILKLTVLIENPHLSEITFKQQTDL